MACGPLLLEAAGLEVCPVPLGTALAGSGNSHEELVQASWMPRALASLPPRELIFLESSQLLPRNSPLRRSSTGKVYGRDRARGSPLGSPGGLGSPPSRSQ